MNVKIEKWKDGRKAAFTMHFDDGLKSHIESAIPQLSERGLKGTFYLNPGAAWFDEKAWFGVANNPNVEFANHSYTHKGVTNAKEADFEISKCDEFIRKLRPELRYPRLISFQYPGGTKWRISENEKKLMLKKYHLIQRDATGVRAAGVHLKTSEELIAIAENAIRERQNSLITFHGVGAEWHSINLSAFTDLLDFLSEKSEDIWVTDPISLHKYKTEFNSGEISISHDDRETTILALRCGAGELYDEPLTLSFATENDNRKMRISQNSKEINFRFSENRVYFDVLPDISEIIIKKISWL